jgi:hypothetical protein
MEKRVRVRYQAVNVGGYPFAFHGKLRILDTVNLETP